MKGRRVGRELHSRKLEWSSRRNIVCVGTREGVFVGF